MHEKSGRAQVEEMLGAELGRFARGVQWIRHQEQPRDWPGFGFRLFGAKHARLSSTVGVATEKDAASRQIPDCRERILQSGAVALGVTRSRGAVGTTLTVGQVAAQDEEACVGKSFRQCN